MRGRSTSAERGARVPCPTLSRSSIASFVASLHKDDCLTIEWRIVPLQAAQPDEAAVPWIVMMGTVIDIEDTNHRGEPSAVIVEYFADVAGVRTSQGTYGLPPQELEGAFIKLKRLERLAPAQESLETSHNPSLRHKPTQVLSTCMKHRLLLPPAQENNRRKHSS